MSVREPEPQAAVNSLNESDTCRRFVVPKLQAAGWENEPHSITEQRYFTDGRIVVRGNRAERNEEYGKLCFNILDYTGTATRNFVDPAFDGDPAFAAQEEIDEYGRTTNTEIEITKEREDNEGEVKEPTGVTMPEPGVLPDVLKVAPHLAARKRR